MSFFGSTVVGHRGAKGLAPENSRKAFEVALSHGLKWVETDIRQTADGHLILHHDALICDMPISRHTLGELNDWLEQQGLEPLMGLNELLEEFAHLLQLNLELKDPACLPPLIKEIERRDLWQTTLISSFYHPIVVEAAAAYPKGKFAPLIACRPLDAKRFMRDFPLCRYVVCDHDFIDENWVSELVKLGITCWLYNVHHPESAQEAISWGVGGIIVDRPDYFGHELANQSSINREMR